MEVHQFCTYIPPLANCIIGPGLLGHVGHAGTSRIVSDTTWYNIHIIGSGLLGHVGHVEHPEHCWTLVYTYYWVWTSKTCRTFWNITCRQ